MIAHSSCRTCGAPLGPDSAVSGLCPGCLLREALNVEDDPGGLSPEFVPAGLAPGSMLGPFRIGRMIGKGGMAAVYEAHEEPPLERTVALKVLPPEFLHDDTFARRFVHEARVIASLEHPSIVPIYASGIDDGIPWISMRLLTGGSLSALLQRGPLSVERTTTVLDQLADALDYAHARGVIHRDIKPSNILLDDSGRAYVCDFGLSRLVMNVGDWTRTGTIVGTPHYMAPEQAISGKVDERCDTYSLGVVAYEMLTGSPPFEGDTPLAVLMQHANAPVPVALRQRCPESMSLAIEKALAKNPGDRWQSAQAFIAALDAATTRHAWSGRRSRIASAAAAILAIAGAGAWWLENRMPADVRVAAVPEQPKPGPPTGPDADGHKSPHGQPRESGKAVPAQTGEKTDRDTSKTPDQNGDPPTQPIVASGPIESSGPEPQKDDQNQTIAIPPKLETEPKPVPPPSMDAAPAAAARSASEPVITEPRLCLAVTPEYPAILQKLGIGGVVRLQGTVGEDGGVSDVRIQDPADQQLNDSARRAFLRFRYEPARRDGVAVGSQVEHTFVFGTEERLPPLPPCKG